MHSGRCHSNGLNYCSSKSKDRSFYFDSWGGVAESGWKFFKEQLRVQLTKAPLWTDADKFCIQHIQRSENVSLIVSLQSPDAVWCFCFIFCSVLYRIKILKTFKRRLQKPSFVVASSDLRAAPAEAVTRKTEHRSCSESVYLGTATFAAFVSGLKQHINQGSLEKAASVWSSYSLTAIFVGWF